TILISCDPSPPSSTSFTYTTLFRSKQAPSNIAFTKSYLAAWDEALAASKKPADLQAKIKAKYPDTALDVIVKIGAESAFAKPERSEEHTSELQSPDHLVFRLLLDKK